MTHQIESVEFVVKVLSRRGPGGLLVRMSDPSDPTAPSISFECEERRGRPEVVSMTFKSKARGRGLRTADLARMNVDRLIRLAYEAAGGPRVGETAYRAATRPGRPRSVTRDVLEQAAHIYEANDIPGGHPRKAVSERMNVSPSTASNYIRKAEQEGLLKKRGTR